MQSIKQLGESTHSCTGGYIPATNGNYDSCYDDHSTSGDLNFTGSGFGSAPEYAAHCEEIRLALLERF